MVTIDMTKALVNAGAVKARFNLEADDSAVDTKGRKLGMRNAPAKEAEIMTFRAILKLFKRHEKAGLYSPLAGYYAIKTSNAQIARLRHVSERTVQRHRQKLTRLGLIHDHVFHGSHCAFEIIVNEVHLGIAESLEASQIHSDLDWLIAESARIESLVEATEKPQSIPIVGGGDKLSAYSSSRDHDNEGKGDVERGTAPHLGGFARPDGGKFEGTQEADGTELEGGEESTGTAKPGDPLAGMGPRHAEQIRALASILWMTGRKWLWPTKAISPKREKQTLEVIHKLYARIPETQLELWHGRFIGMERLAAEYLERQEKPGTKSDKMRFIVPPWKWFDLSVEHGIKGTFKWWQDREKAREDGRAENTLWMAISKWEDNERRPASRQRDRIKLYQSLKASIAAWGRPLLLDEFEICILKSSTNGNEETA